MTTLTRALTVSGAEGEGGEHHVGDNNVTGHTRKGIIGDLKKGRYTEGWELSVTLMLLSGDPHKEGIIGDQKRDDT